MSCYCKASYALQGLYESVLTSRIFRERKNMTEKWRGSEVPTTSARVSSRGKDKLNCSITSAQRHGSFSLRVENRVQRGKREITRDVSRTESIKTRLPSDSEGRPSCIDARSCIQSATKTPSFWGTLDTRACVNTIRPTLRLMHVRREGE